VVVAGLTSTLAALGANDITATVDANGKGPGSSPVDVTVRVPAGVTVISVQPVKVTLTMRPR
jgi:YbbR domain-containing protein